MEGGGVGGKEGAFAGVGESEGEGGEECVRDSGEVGRLSLLFFRLV